MVEFEKIVEIIIDKGILAAIIAWAVFQFNKSIEAIKLENTRIIELEKQKNNFRE